MTPNNWKKAGLTVGSGFVSGVAAQYGIVWVDYIRGWGWSGSAPHWSLLSGIPLLIALAIPGFLAFRIDWWNIRIGLLYSAAAAIGFTIKTGCDFIDGNGDWQIVDGLNALAVVTCGLMIPWAIGRFIWWSSRPHE